MFKKLVMASAISAALLVQPTLAAQSAVTPTVAVINLPLIISEIPQTKIAQEKLAKEFASRENELQKLDADGRKLSSEVQSGKYTGQKLVDMNRKLAQMDSDFKLKAKALQEDQQRRFAEEQILVTTEVQKAIDKIAKERGIQLVLREGAVAYTINALDISKDIIDLVSKAKK